MPRSYSSPGRAHQRRQRTLRVDRPRPKAPRIGAELGQVDRHEHEQDADQDPRAARAELLVHETVAARRRERSAAGAWASCQVSQPAATASTSQVIGSSRKPL